MPIKPDTRYNGTVTAGSRIIETVSGNLGYQVNLTCEDGDTNYVIWLTPKNRERARKSFEALDVDSDKLRNPQFLEYELDTFIEGKEVSFGTREDEYKGKVTTKVAWIGRKSSALEGEAPRAMSEFFAATAKPADAPADKPAKSPKRHDGDIEDDDIPF